MADLKDAPRDGTIVLLEIGDDLVPARWQEETHFDTAANAPGGSWVRSTDGQSWHAIMPDEVQPGGWMTPEEIAGSAEKASLELEQRRAAVEQSKQLIATKLAERDTALAELVQLDRAEAEQARLAALEEQQRLADEAAALHAEQVAEEQRLHEEQVAEQRQRDIASGLLHGSTNNQRAGER